MVNSNLFLFFFFQLGVDWSNLSINLFFVILHWGRVPGKSAPNTSKNGHLSNELKLNQKEKEKII